VELGGKLFREAGVPAALVSAHGATTGRSLPCHSPARKSGPEKKPSTSADSREAPNPCSTHLNEQTLLLLPKSCSNPGLIRTEACPSPAAIPAVNPVPTASPRYRGATGCDSEEAAAACFRTKQGFQIAPRCPAGRSRTLLNEPKPISRRNAKRVTPVRNNLLLPT